MSYAEILSKKSFKHLVQEKPALLCRFDSLEMVADKTFFSKFRPNRLNNIEIEAGPLGVKIEGHALSQPKRIKHEFKWQIFRINEFPLGDLSLMFFKRLKAIGRIA